jgi:Na+-driven multidrug efflux pump
LGKNGLLLSVRTAFLLAAFTFAASAATRIGPEAIAAHQLVAQIFLLATMLADSLEIAGQAMVAEQTSGGDLVAVRALTTRLMTWGVVVGVVILLLVGVGRYALPLLTPDATVASLAVEAAGVAAIVLVVGALVFVADGIFVGLLALGTMALSTGVGAFVAIPLMAWSPLGDTLPGIWWALGIFLAVRGLVFLLGYGRSAEMAVRS